MFLGWKNKKLSLSNFYTHDYGDGNGNPLQYSCLERSLTGYSPLGHKESDMTEQLTHIHTHN